MTIFDVDQLSSIYGMRLFSFTEPPRPETWHTFWSNAFSLSRWVWSTFSGRRPPSHTQSEREPRRSGWTWGRGAWRHRSRSVRGWRPWRWAWSRLAGVSEFSVHSIRRLQMNKILAWAHPCTGTLFTQMWISYWYLVGVPWDGPGRHSSSLAAYPWCSSLPLRSRACSEQYIIMLVYLMYICDQVIFVNSNFPHANPGVGSSHWWLNVTHEMVRYWLQDTWAKRESKFRALKFVSGLKKLRYWKGRLDCTWFEYSSKHSIPYCIGWQKKINYHMYCSQFMD